MYYLDIINRKLKDLLPGVHARTFWGEKLLMAIVDLDAGTIIPNHCHPHEQGGVVLEGQVEFTIDGQIRALSAGDLYLIPGEINHSVTVGDSPARILDIFSPVREEYKYPD